MIKAIIFDFDGVIAESVDIKTKAFAKLFEAEGADIVEKVVACHLENAGVSRFDKFRFFYREFLKKPLTEEVFEKLCRNFSELVMDEVVKAPYVPGAREFFEDHAAEYQCFIASATPQEEMEEIIRRRNMQGYFKRVYGSPKKKADIVREILASFNSALSPQPSALSFQSFVYIGDALSDYEAAKSNGVAFLARITDDNRALFESCACLKLKDLVNLKQAIDSICCHSEKALG